MLFITLGQKIKLFRRRANLSQFELEILIDASPGSICRIEANKVNPTKETLFEISKALNLTKEEITFLFGIIEYTELKDIPSNFKIRL